MANLQLNNVGNAGDILKHGALIALGDFLRAQTRESTINYLDTHAFQLFAPPANASKWEKLAEAHAKEYPAYWRYVAIERRHMPKQYACSVALAREALSRSRLFLCESDAPTRETLKNQLSEIGVAPDFLGEDMLELPSADKLGPPAPLLALVDPFFETDDQYASIWDAACRAVERLHAPGEPGILLAYQWRPPGTSPKWGSPPKGLVGPIAQTSAEGKHHLAVYATDGAADSARSSLRALGWEAVECVVSPTSPGSGSEGANASLNVVSAVSSQCIFDRYITADYSGAADEAAQRERIVLCRAESDAGTPPWIDEGFTRQTLSERLLRELQDATRDGKRLLFAIDHQFSWPLDLLETCGLRRGNWRDSLRALSQGTYGGPPLAHPGEFCVPFNTYASNRGRPQPFFSPSGLYGLPANPQVRRGVPFRLTERTLQREGWAPKPATEIGTIGAVGGQTILGMRQLAWLIGEIERLDIPVAFWPFDGLSIDDAAYKGKHVGVEIYPTLLRPRDWPQSDMNDTLGSALYLRERDASGMLGNDMDLRAAYEDEATIRLEGWIIGCPLPRADRAVAPAPIPPAAASDVNNSKASQVQPMSSRSGLEDHEDSSRQRTEPNPEQREIIGCEAPLVRVIARAGTGKTSTMIWRAERILEMDASAEVLMLTFTRNAADDMRSRFAKSGRDSRRFRAATFHGLALRCLLSFPTTVEIGDGLSFNLERVQLLNEFDRDSVLKYYRSAHPELKDDWEEELSALVNKTDPRRRTPVALLDGRGPAKKLGDPAGVWRGVLQLYAREQLLDFDLVIVLFEYLLRTQPKFLIHSREGFTHFIVDEFQDTNYPQVRCLESLAGYGGTDPSPAWRARQVMVVGDDFQTIYTWRGAVPDIFEEFARLGERTGTPCETKGLRTSWRSARAVLEVVNRAADRLAQDRDHEKLCALVPARLEVGPTGLTGGYEAVSSEGSAFLRSVEKLRECGFTYESISVLTYKNDSAVEARNQLAQGGVVCDLVTARPKDIPGLRRFIRLLAAWFAQGEMDFPIWWGLASEFARLSHSRFDELREHVKKQTPQENWRTLASMVGGVLEDQLLDAFRTEDPRRVDREMLDRLIDRFKVDPEIARDEVACRRLARVLGGRSELQTEPLQILGEMTRKDFAGSAADSEGAVKISTIHQYKGLQNDAVVIRYDFDLREGVEKRRLDYVARSRARSRVVAIGPPMDVADDWGGQIMKDGRIVYYDPAKGDLYDQPSGGAPVIARPAATAQPGSTAPDANSVAPTREPAATHQVRSDATAGSIRDLLRAANKPTYPRRVSPRDLIRRSDLTGQETLASLIEMAIQNRMLITWSAMHEVMWRGEPFQNFRIREMIGAATTYKPGADALLVDNEGCYAPAAPRQGHLAWLREHGFDVEPPVRGT